MSVLLPHWLIAQSAPTQSFACKGLISKGLMFNTPISSSSQTGMLLPSHRLLQTKKGASQKGANLKTSAAAQQLDLLEYKRESLLSITTSSYDVGNPDLMFDQDTLTLMRTANVNPAIIQLEFSNVQTIDQIRVFLGQPGYAFLDKESWLVEAANTLADLEGKTGSYSLIVPLRSDVGGTYDGVTFAAPIKARLFRFTITQTLGDGYVHIPELELWGQTDPTLAKQFEYIRFHNLVVLYKNTNHGTLPASIEEDVQIPLYTASEFIFRNSYFSFFPTWTVYVVEDYAPLFAGDDGWIPPNVIDQDLRSRGLPVNEYDCVYIISNGSNNGAWGPAGVLGKAGYFQTGWWGSEYGKFVTVHEFNHIIDAMFASLGYADFPHNHPDAARAQGEFVGHGGDNWDVDGDIFRYWGRERWLNLNNGNQWGKMLVTLDQDLDGLPDKESTLPLDEERLNSSATSTDSDQDGLSDLQEAMAGKFTDSDPLRADTDEDGINDAIDSFPLYPVSTDVPFKKIDYTSNLTQWPLNGRYYYEHPEHKDRTELRLAFDEAFLYVGIKTGLAITGELHLFLDCNNDGLFYGEDNLHIIFDNNTIKQVILRDATNNFAETSLPAEVYHGITLTGTDWKSYQLAIPRQSEYGLDLTDRESIGMWIRVLDYGNVVGADMFEPNDLFVVTLNSGDQLVVNAKGTRVANQNAHFKLFVNQTFVGETSVTTTYKPYSFHIPFPRSDIQSVYIRFDNDASLKKQDRNLYIQSIEIGGKRIIASRENVRYVSESGKELPYNGIMKVNGDLIFDLAEKLIVSARGSKAKGEYAHFKVLLNNVYIGETFTSSQYKPYSFLLPGPISEQDEIRIRFDNDLYYAGGQDRNLYVEHIQFENGKMGLTAQNTTYIRDNNLQVEYDGTMPFNGDLIMHPQLIDQSSAWEATLAASSPAMQLSLYPNPSHGYFTLNIKATPEQIISGQRAYVDVFDFTGRRVYTTSCSLSGEGTVLPVALESIQSGMYLLAVKVNQHILKQKILIQH
ncbi:carbohydrate-binding domain-containing protein [Xanthocytophaga agilis]|uniref:Carbohydrate-binding domain-containing protein n=1 Tax=Xanthocytophaga agilis TaxID=3048010 RepID=A0AAE3RD76_9BACT|nr:carbohydrate-binding domain-containing protein [Xanthocytophaga agilis]MDJ1506455.1 carbohydrate-binding domain-containing protein [Xanthocytophaga agilis]